jgi:CheY-like chemotaxis protein
MACYYQTAFLLDDDHTANFLHQLVLEENNLAADVKVFTDFKLLLEAFVRLAQQATSATPLPDLLLLDLHLPDSDGLEVLDQLLEIPGIGGSRVCVFLLSTAFNQRWLDRMKDYPISGHLEKPLDEQAVQQLIRSAVRDECRLTSSI